MADNQMKPKKVIWEFVKPDKVRVSDESNKADAEKKFEFVLTRYKDSDTHEEILKIESFIDQKENGSIITTPCTLDSDITYLKRYGVMFSPIVYRDLRKVIEENYLDIHEEPVSLADTDKRDELIEQVIEYVKGDSDLVESDFCYVPVNQFNGLAEDCGYYAYEIKTLRASLAQSGYIRKQGDRFTVLHRINNKPERTIAFYQDKLNVPVPASKKNGRTKTSSADEE